MDTASSEARRDLALALLEEAARERAELRLEAARLTAQLAEAGDKVARLKTSIAKRDGRIQGLELELQRRADRRWPGFANLFWRRRDARS